MKLNNKGWGTLEMILLVIGLLIALIVSMFFIAKLYGSFGAGVNDNKQYSDLEVTLGDAAKKYVGVTGVKVNEGTYKLTFTFLKQQGYIEELKDLKGNDCDGYVIVQNVDNINHFASYIKCPNYTSKNY